MPTWPRRWPTSRNSATVVIWRPTSFSFLTSTSPREGLPGQDPPRPARSRPPCRGRRGRPLLGDRPSRSQARPAAPQAEDQNQGDEEAQGPRRPRDRAPRLPPLVPQTFPPRVDGVRSESQTGGVRGSPRPPALPRQEGRGRHLRHLDRADHLAVSRVSRGLRGPAHRDRRRVPRHGGEPALHQEPHAASEGPADARRGDRGGGSPLGAHPPAHRVPQVQGGRRAPARPGGASGRPLPAPSRSTPPTRPSSTRR